MNGWLRGPPQSAVRTLDMENTAEGLDLVTVSD
jgi:hypothetical protein